MTTCALGGKYETSFIRHGWVRHGPTFHGAFMEQGRLRHDALRHDYRDGAFSCAMPPYVHGARMAHFVVRGGLGLSTISPVGRVGSEQGLSRGGGSHHA